MFDAQAEGRDGRLLDGVMIGVGRMNDGLGGDAADIEAGPTQPTFGAALLDQHGVEAELARADRGDVASGSTADDQYLGCYFGHLTPLEKASPAFRAGS